MDTKGQLIIFCGIPGSGKTTIAGRVAARIGSTVHVQGDAIRFMIPKPEYTWTEARFVYESMFLLGRQALKNRYHSILDGTFLREDYRDQARRRLAGYYSTSTVVCVLCDQGIARARNSQRDAAVPKESFNRLIKSFEEPTRAVFVRSDTQTPESAAEYVIGRLGIRGANGIESGT